MLRIGDKLGDELKIPREYKGKIKDIRKYCTKPELEMLLLISENKVKRVTYSYLENKIDESLLINRVNNFKRNTIQEKKVLNENEKILEENVEFSYNFKLKKLIYSYNLSYENVDGIINDYGSVYFID